jgi:hypothetical protein
VVNKSHLLKIILAGIWYAAAVIRKRSIKPVEVLGKAKVTINTA